MVLNEIQTMDERVHEIYQGFRKKWSKKFKDLGRFPIEIGHSPFRIYGTTPGHLTLKWRDQLR